MQEAEKKKNEPVDESQVIDDVFGFIENEDEKEVKREPSAFRDLPQKKRRKSEVLMGVPSAPEDNEDLTEFSFQKFAKTYFQGEDSSTEAVRRLFKTVSLHCRKREPPVQQEAHQTFLAASQLQWRQGGQFSINFNIIDRSTILLSQSLFRPL